MARQAGSGRGAGGRKIDHSRDVGILDATLDVLADEGFARSTVDLVAERARTTKATIYRRWPSKIELVLDALRHLEHGETRRSAMPDTGTLRGDLLALTEPYSGDAGVRKLRVMAAAASLTDQRPDLVDAVNAATVEPWVAVCRALIERSIGRGESAAVDVEPLSRVVPSMASYRMLVERRPVDAEFFATLIDAVLLPAMRPHDS